MNNEIQIAEQGNNIETMSKINLILKSKSTKSKRSKQTINTISTTVNTIQKLKPLAKVRYK